LCPFFVGKTVLLFDLEFDFEFKFAVYNSKIRGQSLDFLFVTVPITLSVHDISIRTQVDIPLADVITILDTDIVVVALFNFGRLDNEDTAAQLVHSENVIFPTLLFGNFSIKTLLFK